jgi:hypothetical protein
MPRACGSSVGPRRARPWSIAQSLPEEVLLGDLLFESPTGARERGTYALEIEHDGGMAALPIHLR